MSPLEIMRAYADLRADYAEAKAEAEACGHEFPSFEDWTGQDSPKARAQARWLAAEAADELDLY